MSRTAFSRRFVSRFNRSLPGDSAVVWRYTSGLVVGHALLSSDADGWIRLFTLVGGARRRPGQRRVHLAVLGVSVGLVLVLGLVWPSPITPGTGLKPAGVEWPGTSIIGILALSVGLPYFTLAANAPLMQAWYQQEYRGGAVLAVFVVQCWFTAGAADLSRACGTMADTPGAGLDMVGRGPYSSRCLRVPSRCVGRGWT